MELTLKQLFYLILAVNFIFNMSMAVIIGVIGRWVGYASYGFMAVTIIGTIVIGLLGREKL